MVIENGNKIFQLSHVSNLEFLVAVRRLTYLDEGVSPHAIKVCLQFTM
jgi:hypothetical protein